MTEDARFAADEPQAPTALAVTDGIITALGNDEEILALASADTEIIDAEGGVLTPGLIDSHMHPVWGAQLTDGIDLGGLSTVDEVREAIATAAAQLPEDAWVRGWNLDYKVFSEHGAEGGGAESGAQVSGEQIRGDLFDEAAGGLPVALVLMDLHTGVGNAAALAAAGIDGTEEFEDESLVVVDEHGRPTGELREIPAYMMLIDAAPALSQAATVDRVVEALGQTAASGVTTAGVMDGRPQTIEVLEAAEKQPTGLPVRLQIAMWHQPGDDDAAVEERIGLLGTRGARFEVSMIKMFIDGVIDSGTAWLHTPDAEGESQHPFWPSVQRYREVSRRYHQAGFQLATHSCGDAGAAAAARLYAQLGPRVTDGAPHRVEHLETLTDEDVALLAETGTVASMQPLHMQWREADGSDSWSRRLAGERADHAFRVKDIIDAGGKICLGSDWPVAQYDARIGMAWARLRRRPGDPQAPVFEPDQRLSGEEALLGYTRWAAEALGRADLGVIAVGARADLALWERDPVTTEPDDLLSTRVLLTLIDGLVSHHAEDFS
ncbi:amidohydrolase [Nesterenkonia aerolata]|uniref:Amidohydrolase n=1 Tax=Nesterenkonia aerolata TaxID=3074079 RepID=A0ABU2DQX6_9MICC|nr:amidohydrolase [Nesterenkonia sp. LY-0111]MDR8018904.1 amidohydrolase [Nesterenkonia sp. LY-0111]